MVAFTLWTPDDTFIGTDCNSAPCVHEAVSGGREVCDCDGLYWVTLFGQAACDAEYFDV